MSYRAFSSCRLAVVATTGVVLLAVLSGCGFKSDLVPPEPDVDPDLFQPKNLPVLDTSLVNPQTEPEVKADGVAVDIATTTAIEADILIPPTADSGSAGVVVDVSGLSDIVKEGESK